MQLLIMPSAEYNEPDSRGGDSIARSRCLQPLKNSGSLDIYNHNDLTPVIGREFEGVQAIDLLKGDEQLIKDLAVTSTSKSKQRKIRCLS